MFSLVFLPAALCLWAKKRIIILIHGLPEQHFAELFYLDLKISGIWAASYKRLDLTMSLHEISGAPSTFDSDLTYSTKKPQLCLAVLQFS